MRTKCKCSQYQLNQVGCGCEAFEVYPIDFTGNGFFNVQIELDTGERFDHYKVFENESDAQALAVKVVERGEIDPQYWNQGFPRYGSSAFIRDENEAVAHIPMLQNGLERLEDLPRHLATLL